MSRLTGNWLDIAKSLPVGGRVKTMCCGNSPSMSIRHKDNGYSYMCFRCGDSDFEPHGIRSISTLLRHKAEAAIMNQETLQLPKDYTLELPRHALLWVLKAGISPELAASYGIGYSPSTDRVVLPVYTEGNLDALQLRAVSPDTKPKYLNPKGRDTARALFKAGTSTGITVVVEDILSAIKVAKVAPAAAILGTSLTDAKALRLSEENHTVIVWLDNDAAGIKGTRKAIKKLKMLGLNVYRVTTLRDPKTYNEDEIKEALRGIE